MCLLLTVSGLLRRYTINSDNGDSVPEIVQGTVSGTIALNNLNVRDCLSEDDLPAPFGLPSAGHDERTGFETMRPD